MEQETNNTFQTPTDDAAAAVAVDQVSLYPLDQTTATIKVKKGIVAGVAQFAEIGIRRPTAKELIEREKKSRTGFAQVSKHESQLETEDESADLQLASALIHSIAGYDLKDGAGTSQRAVNAGNVGKIPATIRLAALKGLYASSCDIYTLDLENGVAVIKQEIGAGNEPDFTIFHTLAIDDEKLRTSYKSKTQSVRVNSKDPRIQRQTVHQNLAKVIEFYDTYLTDLDGVSIDDQAYHDGLRTMALSHLDAYWKRQVMTCLMAALEDGLTD